MLVIGNKMLLNLDRKKKKLGWSYIATKPHIWKLSNSHQ